MSEFISGLVKDLDDEHTSVAAEGKSSAEFSGTIDTGSYVLNAVLSGSIYCGVANNKITVFAGEAATGKTFFVLGVVKQFLETHKDAVVIYFDTESAVTNEMMQMRGIDTKRVVKSEPESIQKFRHVALNGIDHYINQDKDVRPPMMMVLDSLGQLSTTKELVDTAEGSETKDMTKAAILKATFRVLNLKLAQAGIPLLVCNHVYDVVGSYIPMKEMSGGSGLKYSASTIAFLSKKKEKDGQDVVGNLIRVTMQKSRLSKENKKISCLLTYDKGLDRYYGLVELAVESGIWKKIGNRIDVDGTKLYEKAIYKDPDKYFTSLVMEKIEDSVKKEFTYGTFIEDEEVIDPDVETIALIDADTE